MLESILWMIFWEEKTGAKQVLIPPNQLTRILFSLRLNMVRMVEFKRARGHIDEVDL